MRSVGSVLALVLTLVGCSAAPPTEPPPTGSPASTVSAPAPEGAATPAIDPVASAGNLHPTPHSATLAPAPPQHRIAVRERDGRRELYDTTTGEPFRPRGANLMRKHFSGGGVSDVLFGSRYDPAWVDTELGRLAGLGYNTVRVFVDLCNDDCIAAPGGGGLSTSYVDHMADFLSHAKSHGVVVLMTSNDLPDAAQYGNAAPCCAPFGGYRNSIYLSPQGHALAERYWRDIVGGLIERRAATDTVLAWQLVNEQFTLLDVPPLSMRSGAVATADGREWDMADDAQRRQMVDSNLVVFADRLAGALREIDPTGLVTIGYFPPNEPEEWRPDDTRLVLTQAVLEQSSLDFADLHGYPGGSLSFADHAAAYGISDQVAMPLVLGEMGGFKHTYANPAAAAEALVAWQVESCAYGFQGWLLWLEAPFDDEVWTGTQGDGVIDRALSPVERPDPCAEGGWIRHNLAAGRPARASSALPNEPPGAAVDELIGTQWGAGAHAPQWVEIDLGELMTVAAVELVVAQFPEGETHHRVLVGAQRGALEAAGTLRGSTADGDVLLLALNGAAGNAVRFVRIETLSSPSWVAWREVRVFDRL